MNERSGVGSPGRQQRGVTMKRIATVLAGLVVTAGLTIGGAPASVAAVAAQHGPFYVWAITLTSHHVVKYSDYPACKHDHPKAPAWECVWNLNGDKAAGRSFFFDGDRRIYVWPADPTRGPWAWVPGDVRASYAERGLAINTSCMYRDAGGYVVVRCASGRVILTGPWS